MEMIRAWFRPNLTLGSTEARIMVAFQTILFLLIWSLSDFPLLPSPYEIGAAWWKLINDGLGYELASSLTLTIEATVLTLIVSLTFVYLSAMPFFRPITKLLSQFRFNGLVGLTLFFGFMVSNGHDLKIVLLVFSMSVWFITSMCKEVASIPDEEFDHARTLGMSEWRVVLEVVVIGRVDAMLDVLRQNTAISWLMLTTVEGMFRNEGGVGAMLMVSNKYLKVSEVLAIQLTILVVGIGLDWCYGWLRRMLFPYAELGKKGGR